MRISNLGDKTAYNNEISWNQSLKKRKEENISTIGDEENVMQIPVLQKGQELNITFGEVSKFFGKYTDDELSFDRDIKVCLSKNSKFSLNQSFALNLFPFRKTL